MGQPVEIDVLDTPMYRVASDASVVRTLLEQRSDATARIQIVRYDPKDPKPYNVDDYDVWVDLLSHPSLSSMIIAASTELNQNFRDFAAQNVFILKRDPGPDHWLAEIPGSATTIIRTT